MQSLCWFGAFLATLKLAECRDECFGAGTCARFPAVTLGILDARDAGPVR
jgi:hypothetical protein